MVLRSLVSVVDDDESVRESLPDLLNELGFAAQTYASAEAFLASDKVDVTGCLILDIAMPGMSGPELVHELNHLKKRVPVIFITAHGDGKTGSELIGAGVVACLLKPFSESALLEALHAAFGEH
ncbi:two component LuxR family transcriptional regulator [Caballeronia sordidicola]|uniref:Two component LuxR family transcriptional regulator n=2 Tax=Caballeronia sordidicola TaxID=196367 RepID=A0A158H5Q6_CABSO|nr:two component LuxR family transcriptional regulator [Caballeronia sordidicola]